MTRANRQSLPETDLAAARTMVERVRVATWDGRPQGPAANGARSPDGARGS